MTEVLEPIEQAPLVVHPIPSHRMDNDEFFDFCQLNGDLRIERSSEGDIILMAPTGGSSGRNNAKLIVQFGVWAERDGTGTIFDSATGFILPNSAVRAPDVSWVINRRLDLITDDQWEKFLPLCPDFVLELRSRTDPLHILQAKLSEYLANGARLGWLIDPIRQQVHIYRPGRPVEVLAKPPELTGEEVLPGFTLELAEIWSRR